MFLLKSTSFIVLVVVFVFVFIQPLSMVAARGGKSIVVGGQGKRPASIDDLDCDYGAILADGALRFEPINVCFNLDTQDGYRSHQSVYDSGTNVISALSYPASGCPDDGSAVTAWFETAAFAVTDTGHTCPMFGILLRVMDVDRVTGVETLMQYSPAYSSVDTCIWNPTSKYGRWHDSCRQSESDPSKSVVVASFHSDAQCSVNKKYPDNKEIELNDRIITFSHRIHEDSENHIKSRDFIGGQLVYFYAEEIVCIPRAAYP